MLLAPPWAIKAGKKSKKSTCNIYYSQIVRVVRVLKNENSNPITIAHHRGHAKRMLHFHNQIEWTLAHFVHHLPLRRWPSFFALLVLGFFLHAITLHQTWNAETMSEKKRIPSKFEPVLSSIQFFMVQIWWLIKRIINAKYKYINISLSFFCALCLKNQRNFSTFARIRNAFRKSESQIKIKQ